MFFLLNAIIVPRETGAVFSSQPYIPESIVSISSGYAIVVDKQTQKLYVFQKNGSIVKVFEAPCSTGKRPGAKQEPGDARTPNGIFFVQKFYNDSELTSIYGPMAFHLDFPNLIDRRYGRNGTNIWIHGTNKPLQPFQSNGCIAMRNKDIELLAGYICLNKTPVIIEETIKWIPQDQKSPARNELEHVMLAWDTAVNDGDSKALDLLYTPDSREKNEHKVLLQKSNHLRSLVRHLPMYPRDVTILKQDNTAVILFDKITSVKNDVSFQGIYVKLFLEKIDDRWLILEDVPQPALQQTARTARAAKEQSKDVKEAQAVVVQQVAQKQPQQVAELQQPPHASQLPSTVAQSSTQPPDRAIAQLVEKWADSWQSGNMKEYRACYAPDFRARGMNLGKWIEYKSDLSRRYKHISVRISNVKVTSSGIQTARVTFVQKYSASGGPRASGVKMLELRKIKDSWKICSETMAGRL